MVGDQMSLRVFFRVLALGLLALLAALAISLGTASPAPPAEVSEAYRALAERAEVTRGSVLVAGGPALEFPLPASADAVRLLSNANLRSIEAARAQRAAQPAHRWQYVIEVETLDASGKVLQRRLQHYRRDLVELTLPAGGVGTGSFYLEQHAPAPLAAAQTRLGFGADSHPDRVRLKLVSADPEIADVLVRMAVPTPVSQANADLQWKRLSEAQREKLASGNVFPPKLLTALERESLIQSRWQPIGPMGSATARDIYVLRGFDLGAPTDPAQPEALTAGPGRLAVVQLPENGGHLRIELEALDDSAAPAEVALRWSGHSAFLRNESRHAWETGRFQHEKRFDGGWLEIGASRAAKVRVVLLQDGLHKDITPVVRYLRSWVADGDQALNFSLSHEADSSTPLRLVFRRNGSGGKPASASSIALEFLGSDGSVLKKLALAPQFQPSLYDAPWPEAEGESVTDPWEAFFSVPADVARLRVVAPEAVLVNAYVRPPKLARSFRMPEDFTTPEAAESAIPGWFALNPEQHDARILRGESQLLTVRDRPPEERPELSAGDFQWEDFDPVGAGAARVFLAPREEGVPERMDAMASTFRPLQQGQPVQFVGQSGREGIAPRLAWTGANGTPFRYTVLLDGVEWMSGASAGSAGEVSLPPFDPGMHRIELVSEQKLHWYASHLKEGKPWVRRRAYHFDKPLRFDIERTGTQAEYISVRLFRPAHLAARQAVRVKIDAPKAADDFGPHPGWLFAERVYDVRPGGELALPVAETKGDKTDAGQPLFIPIPEGAPRGRYRLTLTPQDRLGWVSVSRVMPGAAAVPTLIVERTRELE